MSLEDNQELGVESLLGPDAAEDAQTLRDRLVLATRYLANWYRATKGSENQAIWWQKIDIQRRKVEDAYRELSKQENLYFAGRAAQALYLTAATSWPQLWRELKLSPDTLPEPALIDVAADYITAVAQTPANIITEIGNQAGKAVGGAAGQFLRQAWWVLIVAGAVGAVYILRKPIGSLIGKAAA